MKEIQLYGLNDFLRDVKNTQEKESSNISIFHSDDAPDILMSGNPFRNDSYVLVFILEGETEITIDFNSYFFEAKSVFFGTPGQVYSSDNMFVNGFGILFKEEFFATAEAHNWLLSLPIFHRFYSRPLLKLERQVLAPLVDQLKLLLEEYNGNSIYKYESLKSHLSIIIIGLSRIYIEQHGQQHKRESHQILRLESLIDAQFKEMRNVKEYADQMFMSPQNLNRITKEVLGKSVSELIHEKLIIEIKRHLIFTDKSSEEIAYYLNFHDNSYFTKYFKKSTGVTPKEFRIRSSQH